MKPRATTRRDAGLALISRINRWMIAATVALAGVISLAAKSSFHGRTSSASSSSSQGSQSSSSSSAAGSLSQPAQAPAVSPVAPAPVVSGGS